MREFPVAVKLLDFTAPTRALYGSKLCVNQEKDVGKYTADEMKQYLLSRIKSGHESIIEHIVLVVEVSNMSRALLQQFARHRLLSLSVQSTRWALGSIMDDDAQFVLPEVLQNDPKVIDYLERGTDLVLEMRKKYGNDVAKYLLPDCTPTKMLVTGNIREWRHIYKLRKDPPAMKEFNDFCKALYEEVNKVYPILAEILAY